ncbi:MAG: response regulator [Nitrososphaerales archaeon]
MSARPLEADTKKSVLQRRIAIIEDVESLSQLYAKTLEFKGHKVVARANSAEEFLELAREKGFLDSVEIAIIDYRLGMMNGFELAKIILARNPSIRIIFASAEESIEKEARAAGFSYLKKPFTMKMLVDEIGTK